MKKIVSLFIVCVVSILLNTTYAITENFQFVIDTVGIPRYNTYGEEINEDVYYTYNIFSYGRPETTRDINQRWKNSNYGFWTKSGGSYKGSGTRGEYYVLGKSYSGALIYNYYFPMDVIPATTPDKWTFYSYPGAAESWKDTTKYKYAEQLEHMKNSKLMFNDISSRARADNPAYIREYNITPNRIGLSKARLDTAATWKTYGMVSTRRYISGVIYSQVYLVKPMAADAKSTSTLELENDYILKENRDELLIPIKYSTSVVNMTGYAKKEHIKEINTKLYIENKKVDEISGSKITSVGNEYMLVITRDDYPPNINHSVNISVNGYIHTEFAVDGLMQSNASKTINVYVEPKQKLPVKQSNLKVLEKDATDWVVRPLAQISNTETETLGFIEAGKTLAVKLELNIDKEKLNNIQVLFNDTPVKEFEIYNTTKDLALKVQIPKETKTTLYGIYSLRDELDNYFDISTNEIGTRKDKPHSLKIKFEVEGKEHIEEFLFDTLDSYISNVNSIAKNAKNSKEYIRLKEWIEIKDD